MKLKNQLERKFRRYFPKRIQNANQFLTPLKGKNGLEIGGPSPSLSHQGFLPVYDVLKALDGCNFGAQTVWEGNLAEGNNYSWGNKKGRVRTLTRPFEGNRWDRRLAPSKRLLSPF